MIIRRDAPDGFFKLARELGLSLLTITADSATVAKFSLQVLDPGWDREPGSALYPQRAMLSVDELSHPSDVVLLLHTSGTSTGGKKVVPFSLRQLAVGAACIIKTWTLSDADTAMNMMPLFHIGGIARMMLAPLLAGGAVVFAEHFDPVIFWELLQRETLAITWYYCLNPDDAFFGCSLF